MALEKGASAEVSATVTDEMTARAVGSGEVSGLATPMMIALMEAAAVKSVADMLEEGSSSVGTSIAVEHSAPTPVGMEVTASAELTEVVGRRLVFEVLAVDEAGEIGRGTHERFVVGADSFEKRIAERGGN